ncbi:MAG: hypothetical protein DRQ55_00605 [Planctomycetota bacterium]|nr:MAG: hypothetical protein DRQ55_00605 [Planctomycetota bacterium]
MVLPGLAHVGEAGAGRIREICCKELARADDVEPVGFTLTSGLEGASGSYVLGAGELGAAFKAVVLVPTAGVIAAIVTGSDGESLIVFPWPASVLGGFSLYVQVWLSDPDGPLGYSASNAVRLDVP